VGFIPFVCSCPIPIFNNLIKTTKIFDICDMGTMQNVRLLFS